VGGWLEGAAARFADAVLTVENRLRSILASRGIPAEKIHVLMNLPDDRIFAPIDRPSVRRDTGRFVVVYHGTLARRLGLDLALEAVARARGSIPGLELRIIGDGEERGHLLELRRKLGLEGTVTFSDGFVPVERIPELIADADVGIVPLRVSPGTDIMLPTKLLEYTSLGIPTICPRTNTIRAYFDEEMVEFFEAGDPDSLAEAILRLHADPDWRASLAEQAAARFADRYRWTSHKKVYTELVTRLLER
jgi:glycosyltransferase involved in cell wall biosynthesis